MATDDYAKIEHDMAAMLRESFPVTWKAFATQVVAPRPGYQAITWRRAKSSDQAAKTNIDIGWEKRKSKFVRTKTENPNCAF